MRLRSRNARRVLLTSGRSDSPLHRPDNVREATMPQFAGLTIRDKSLAALLEAAEAQGFRLEQATNGGHPTGTGLVAYPPDPSHRPVRFGVSTVNPKHVANVRSNLRLAGFTDEEPATTNEEPPVPKTSNPNSITQALNARPQIVTTATRYEAAEQAMEEALRKGGVTEDVIALTRILQHSVLDWSVAAKRIASEVDREEVEQALALAAEAEKRATAAEARLAKAEEREQQARSDCAAALDRAKQAEARAEAADAALRPLRAFLATGQ